MKKTYSKPQTKVMNVKACLPIATSDPTANINLTSEGADPGDFEVKESRNAYNVWDDDWSK